MKSKTEILGRKLVKVGAFDYAIVCKSLDDYRENHQLLASMYMKDVFPFFLKPIDKIINMIDNENPAKYVNFILSGVRVKSINTIDYKPIYETRGIDVVLCQGKKKITARMEKEMMHPGDRIFSESWYNLSHSKRSDEVDLRFYRDSCITPTLVNIVEFYNKDIRNKTA